MQRGSSLLGGKARAERRGEKKLFGPRKKLGGLANDESSSYPTWQVSPESCAQEVEAKGHTGFSRLEDAPWRFGSVEW